MKRLRKNLFLLVSTALSLIIESASGLALAAPDNPKTCLPFPVSGPSVKIAQPIAPYVAELNVEFNDQAGYCLNDYFSSPNGEPLSYEVFLCDQGWNPIPGLMIQYQGLINDDNWIKLTRSPQYLSFVPLSIDDIGLYYVNITATDGTATASQQFKVNVFQFNDAQTDYVANWIAVGSGLVAGLGGALGAAKAIWAARDEGKILVTSWPKLSGVLSGALVGGALGWAAELVNICASESKEEASKQWWIMVPITAVFATIGGVLIPYLVSKYSPGQREPLLTATTNS